VEQKDGTLELYNLIKASKKGVVKEIPKFIKPSNLVCKHCQLGKKTRVRFKTKEHYTSKPLEIVHTDLFGPLGIESYKGNTNSC
jgi:hypothetical protein